MRLSPRMLTVAGIGFVLLAVAFVLLKENNGLFSKTEESARSNAKWNGSDTRKHDSRDDPKRSRGKRGLSVDDPEVQREAEQRYQELLARHPEFKVEFKDVPDEENGFLKYLDLIEKLKPDDSFRCELPIDDDFRDMLEGRKTFDTAILDAWIEKNPDLFQSILEIAEAPGQSVKGLSMDRYHFVGGRPAMEMNHLLLSSARAALERGNPDEALRYHRASQNLANHFDGTEIYSLLGKTVSTLLRMSAVENFHQHILPELINDPETLAEWSDAIPITRPINDVAPEVFKGEWHLTTRMLLLPTLISADPSVLEGIQPLTTAEQYAVAESYTSRMSDRIDEYSMKTLADLTEGSRETFEEDPSLSPSANLIHSALFINVRPSLKGLVRQTSVTAQYEALLAIALDQEPPPDPITGEPFLWDPETRTLSPPVALDEFDVAKIKPLKLTDSR
jgi:hypothetical protein